MRTIFLSFLFALTTAFVFGQSEPMEPAFKRFPTIPPFSLLKVDSSEMTRDNLSRHKPTLIMYFSPDCDHCQHQTKDMLAAMSKLKDVQIVMASYQPFEEIQKFNTDYKLANYKNITLGRDTKFFFVPFYQVMNLPFIALYDKHQNLITTFEGNVKIEKLAKAFGK